MGVYKDDKTNTWRVIYRYTDWTGEQKQSSRRGFASKHEAQAWEREQMNKVTADLDMTFASFVEHYTEDLKTRLKENTWSTKDHIIRTKLIPYFGKLKMCAVTPQIVMTWQNEMLRFRDKDGKPYSPVYLRTVQNQLTAIFNHAMKYYNLRENPCRKAGLSPHRTEPADRHLQSCHEVLQSPGKPLPQSWSARQEEIPGYAVLDEGRISEICRRHDG